MCLLVTAEDTPIMFHQHNCPNSLNKDNNGHGFNFHSKERIQLSYLGVEKATVVALYPHLPKYMPKGSKSVDHYEGNKITCLSEYQVNFTTTSFIS